MKKLRQFRGGYQVSGLKNFARELRNDKTAAENSLWVILRNRNLLGFKFRRQHQIGDYIADFYCREAQLVIECDGSVHSGHEAWQHDQKRDAYMISQGLRVLRFTNGQILNDTEALLKEISKHLMRIDNPPSPLGEGRGEGVLDTPTKNRSGKNNIKAIQD
jgi:very-short-patch-repair endonuclease